MTDKKKAREKETQPTRLRTLRDGAALLAGSVVVGLVLLKLISFVPGHQESLAMQPILWGVSLAMMGGALWGAWMIVKSILGFK